MYRSIAKYIVPRLKVFILEKDTRPQELTKDEWNEVLKKILWSFEYMLKDCYYSRSLNKKEETEKLDEGLQLFSRYIKCLWI